MSFVTKIGEDVKVFLTSQDQAARSEANISISKTRLYAVAVAAASLALAILGFALCLTGAWTGMGVLLLLVCSPGIYFGINGYQTLCNVKDMLDKFSANRNNPSIPKIDLAALKKDLRQSTLCFEWVSDLIIEKIIPEN